MEDAEPPTVEVCLILEGESERSIVVSVTTSDGSAIGRCMHATLIDPCMLCGL